MRRFLSVTSRVVVIGIVGLLVASAVRRPERGAGPYASVLMNVGVGTAAAQLCPNKHCIDIDLCQQLSNSRCETDGNQCVDDQCN
jgi:hypothetical protein